MQPQRMNVITATPNGWDPHPAWIVRIIGAIQMSQDKHVYGVPEEEVLKASGLEAQSFMKTLTYLVRKDVVSHQMCQEGTAGPFAHRYKVEPNAVVTLEISFNEAK